MDDLVDLVWLEKTLKGNGAYDVSRVLSVDISPAAADGDNYASTLLRLGLSTLSTNGRPTLTSLVLKRNLDLTKFDRKDGDVSNVLHEAYKREYNFYVNVLPKVETFLADNEKIRAECFVSEKNFDMFFEDLKESGYHLANRLVGLDVNHCELVFKNLGKFHAATYLAVNSGLVDVDEFKKYPIIDGTTGKKKKKTSAFEFMADVVTKDWGHEWASLGERLDGIKMTIRDQVEAVGRFDQSRINVINHGDTWVNNFMFKYGPDGKPTSLRFIDFQMPHYNSLAFDLSYFLNSSVSGAVKRRHEADLIRVYCESFCGVLDARGSTLPCPTPASVAAELERIAPFSLNVAVRVRPVIMCKPECSLPLPELVKDNGLTEAKRRIYANQDLAEVLKIDLPLLFAQLDKRQ